MVIQPNDIIITGVPRSGTTLTCHLLNKIPDTIALHEPMNLGDIDLDVSDKNMVGFVQRFFVEQRQEAVGNSRVLSIHRNGEVPDNPILYETNSTGKRFSPLRRGWIPVAKELSDVFTLAVKHNTCFTAFLDVLVGRYPIVVLIRNPWPVLASWNSIDFPAGRGRLSIGEKFDAQLKAELEAIDDVVERQIHILGWFFGKFKKHEADLTIIPYEELVATGGRVLASIVPAAVQLKEPLEDRMFNPAYDKSKMKSLGERLVATDGPFWDFYDRSEVVALLPSLKSR